MSFTFNDIPCKVFIAAEYDTDILMNYLQQNNNPLQSAEYLEGQVSIVKDDWVNSQTELTKDIIRLANYWTNSIPGTRTFLKEQLY